MPYILDIETNAIILPRTIHCAVLLDTESSKVYKFANQPGYDSLREFIGCAEAIAASGDQLIGHNIASFDVPQMRRIYGAQIPKSALLDTLHVTRACWPDLREQDRKDDLLPVKLHGRHSLAAWGIRLGVPKDKFGEMTDWQRWSPAMMEYCVMDCIACWRLYVHLLEAAR